MLTFFYDTFPYLIIKKKKKKKKLFLTYQKNRFKLGSKSKIKLLSSGLMTPE